jgi:predicted Zn finger-like uncharacterized protein
MRITCPGCGAAYVVPDRAVPDPGRDVQCAACGASWYILKGAAEPAASSIGDRPAGAADAPPDGDGAGSDADGARARPDVDGPPRRRVDPEVLAILREAAETERRARTAAQGKDGDPSAHGPDMATGARAGGPVKAGRSVDAGVAPGDPATPAAGPEDARARLARLTAAERHNAPAGQGATTGDWRCRTEDADGGLVEDPGADRRGRRPPLLGMAAEAASPATTVARTAAGLPVAVTSREAVALVRLERRRRGFRLGFAASAGLCCGALALYVAALHTGSHVQGPVIEAVLHHGGQLQAALVDWLRRVVVPALS